MNYTPVLIITYYWPPSGGAGVQRWLSLSGHLSKIGIEPLILTVDPAKASYPVVDQSLVKKIHPGLKVFHTSSFEWLNAYKKINPRKEIPYGGFTNEAEKGFFKKASRFIRGNFFIPDARIGWNKHAFEEACRLIELYNIKHIITTSPPHSTQLIGINLKKKYRLQWIADIRDPWTDIYYYKEFYHLPFAKKKDASLERETLKNADQVVTVSRHIKNLFIEKVPGINENKFHVIPNGFDEENYSEESVPQNFTILYTGTLTADYNTSGFFSALNKFKENGISLVLKFIGSVNPEFRDRLQRESFHRVEFQKHIPHESSIAALLASSVQLLIIPEIHDNKGILTGKLFDYLGTGKPILGIGPVDGEAAEIVYQCQAGGFFDYHDGEGIYTYLMALIKGYETKPDKKEVIRYSRKAQAASFKNLLSLS
jgi:glycosyltransferase involved in cell wall biosynthesis